MSKTYLEMTVQEIDKRLKLTPSEQSAVDAFIAAAKALPKSICVELEDYDFCDEGEPNLTVSKRITQGSCKQVASLRKKSLSF